MKQNIHTCNKESEIAEIHTIVKRIDASWFGNGTEGYKTKLDRVNGGFSTFKWLVGSGLFSSIILTLILHFLG